jgi:hypothetical protein
MSFTHANRRRGCRPRKLQESGLIVCRSSRNELAGTIRLAQFTGPHHRFAGSKFFASPCIFSQKQLIVSGNVNPGGCLHRLFEWSSP